MTLTDQQTSHLSSKKSKVILCIICNRTRCYAKYRRHLLTHVKNGELDMEKVHKVLFNGWSSYHFFDYTARIITIIPKHFKVLKNANKLSSNNTCFD